MLDMLDFPKGTVVYSRGGDLKGVIATGNPIRCTLEGCRGHRYAVRWPDKHITYPCSRGIGRKNREWEII